MIALDDLIAFCGLKPEEVQAIAEHEHLSAGMAAAFGQALLQTERGPERIRDMLIAAMRSAIRRHDVSQARQLVSTLRAFLNEHPVARLSRMA
jgi:hypothetical protein